MAKKQKTSSMDIAEGFFFAVRPYLLPTLAATFGILLLVVVFQRFEGFLVTDERFLLRPAEPGATGSPDVSVQGASLASIPSLQAVFAADEGRSVFSLPLAERAAQVRKVQWVKSARVSRIWPNRVAVAVEERNPVAFVHLDPVRRGQPVRPRLIDAEGEILPLVEHRRFTLPVLTGVRTDQTRDQRVRLVRIMTQLLRELGEPGRRISEIDVSSPDNLRIVYPTAHRAITLIMGDREWRARLEKFLRHYPEIRQNMPNAVELDLRLEGHIPAVQWDKAPAEREGRGD
ncbi:MAG: FtsQ-type POTRA domain-containing protein [Bryobacteraceae bacterium]